MTKQEFWLWFEEHLTDLEKLIISQSVDYSIYDALTEKLTQFDKHLIPEITMDEQERYILILSCDGNREGMPALEYLAENPKEYANWKIVKYRQPGPMIFIPV
jgi:hypothetical protein